MPMAGKDQLKELEERGSPWLGGRKLGLNGCANEAGGCSPFLPAAIPKSSTQAASASAIAALSCHSRQITQGALPAMKKTFKIFLVIYLDAMEHSP